MRETSLVYIVKDEKVLMLHRIRKKNDENHGKWIGVGGKFEQGECPEDCMRREVLEETGLHIDRYRYCGIVTFQNDDAETEFMHLFLVTAFHKAGETHAGDAGQNADDEVVSFEEGDLAWLSKSRLTRIPHWAGDRIFLSLIFAEPEVPFFSLKLVYRKGDLIRASLNEHNCLVTDRLILRPFLERDARSLYEQAKNPAIGLPAGWPPHKSPQESLGVIRGVLSRPEAYAIVLRDTADPVGAVALQNFRLADENGSLLTFYDERRTKSPLICTMPESGAVQPGVQFEAELGYWLGEKYWGSGLMTEAAQAVIAHGFRDLNLSRIWCGFYRGNERSAATQKRLGFHYHHVNGKAEVKLLEEVREEIVNVMTREEWLMQDGAAESMTV